MIKRIRFSSLEGDVPLLAASADAPADVRPCRVTVSRILPGLIARPRHSAVGQEWFTDDEHLARCEAWSARSAGPAGPAGSGGSLDAATVMVADEHVVRGGDWLERRWAEGGRRLKHLAVARRAPQLTLAEFLERWAGHAGSFGGRQIPEEARGAAYIQNHPRHDGGPSSYDACTEVYVEDLPALRARVAYFDASSGAGLEGELFAGYWFMAVAEDVLLASGPPVPPP